MSSESEEQQLSKKAAKQEKLRRRQEAAALASAASSLFVEEDDPYSSNYDAGQCSLVISSMEWTPVGALTQDLKEKEVLIRERVHITRPVSKNMAFVVVREKGFTVQCLITTQGEGVSRQMVKFVARLNRESIVDAIGVVSVPGNPIKGTTQQVEIHLSKLYICIMVICRAGHDILRVLGKIRDKDP
ncbi:aspartate--tRNA ligase 2, cytoplasmic-like [Hibiscus syriacus]|uniref:aspartate--tRNA ligase 2, cytoplasmic-like n=1 Tax=Hibiscus syriacus TaxID=106335 RepID=UPI001924A29F|nr:aspartate--tRNA ligase 2, cytoplasmic-like [Hibiscus syriacus]